MAKSTICYVMERGDHNRVADVVTLPNGKCIVSWPTSTIVYDSERDARDVHIRHMGGRGEKTKWVAVQASRAFWRGWWVCYQDRCEGIPDASGPRAPHYIEEGDRADYEAGYLAMSLAMYGEDYVPDESKWQGQAKDEPEPNLANAKDNPTPPDDDDTIPPELTSLLRLAGLGLPKTKAEVAAAEKWLAENPDA